MKLKTFNPQNVIYKRKSNITPKIGVNVESGLFNLNMPSCKQIGLKEGSRIQFYQDEELLKNWYLQVVPRNGFLLQEKQKSYKGLVFFCKKLAQELFESVGYKGKSGRIEIGKAIVVGGRKLTPIVTSGLKKEVDAPPHVRAITANRRN